ncbi:MAG: hypothetical protein WDO24_11045 [Pseudomonadota bacterium]
MPPAVSRAGQRPAAELEQGAGAREIGRRREPGQLDRAADPQRVAHRRHDEILLGRTDRPGQAHTGAAGKVVL